MGDDKPNFSGKYQHIKSENFEDFLRENGANWMIRKMATAASPTLEITHDGNNFHMKLVTLLKSREQKFVIGEDYEAEEHSGAMMKISPSWDGNKLILSYEPKKPEEGKPQKHIRELDGDDLTLTMEVGEIVAKRYFKRCDSKDKEEKKEEPAAEEATKEETPAETEEKTE